MGSFLLLVNIESTPMLCAAGQRSVRVLESSGSRCEFSADGGPFLSSSIRLPALAFVTTHSSPHTS